MVRALAASLAAARRGDANRCAGEGSCGAVATPGSTAWGSLAHNTNAPALPRSQALTIDAMEEREAGMADC